MRILDNLIIFVAKKVWRKMETSRGFALLRIDRIRIGIVSWRKSYFIERKGSLRVWDGSQNAAVLASGLSTVQHNLEGLHDIDGTRGLRVIRPLSVIETYRPLSIMPMLSDYDQDYICDAKVLDIGPRTEGELFSLIAYGFKMENIRGLDLISYSPLIDLGDMHKMPYGNDSFDITIASCVLVYSTNPIMACEEMLRVTKNGGLICISQDTVPQTGQYAFGAIGKQLIRVDDYLDLFSSNVDRVFFRHEMPERLKPIEGGSEEGSNYTASLIFSIKKPGRT